MCFVKFKISTGIRLGIMLVSKHLGMVNLKQSNGEKRVDPNGISISKYLCNMKMKNNKEDTNIHNICIIQRKNHNQYSYSYVIDFLTIENHHNS